MHSPRSRPLRRPPGLFPVYSSRSLLKEEGRWARKERRDVEEKEKENLHQQTADCQLPYKYININSVYIYIYISHCGCFLPRFTKDFHRLLLPGVDFFLEEVLPSKLKPRATNRAADLIFLSRDFLLPHFPLCRNGRRTGNGSREHPRQTKRRGRDTFVE